MTVPGIEWQEGLTDARTPRVAFRVVGGGPPLLLLNMAEHRPSLRGPTLVVHGTADPMIPVENGRIVADTIPGARLVVLDGVGHMVAIEAPERLAEAVEGFLADTDPPCGEERKVGHAAAKAQHADGSMAPSHAMTMICA